MNDNKIINLSSELKLEFLSIIRVNNSEVYKYNLEIKKTRSINTYQIFSESNLHDDSIDKNKLTEYIAGLIDKDGNKKEIYLVNSEIDRLRITSGNSNVTSKEQTYAYGLNIYDYDKLDEGRKKISNLVSDTINGFEYSTYSSAIATIPAKYSDVISAAESAIASLASGASGDPTTAVTGIKEVLDEQWKHILDFIIAAQEMKIQNGKTLPDIDAIGIGETEEEYNERFKNDAIDFLKNTNFEYFSDFQDKYSNFMFKYTRYSSKEVSDILSATDIEEGTELTDEQKQIYEIRKQLINNFGKILGLNEQQVEDLVSNNLGELVNLIDKFDVLNSSDIDITSYVYQLEDMYYSTEDGQKALLEKCIKESGTEYDEYNAIGYTEYIKYCKSRAGGYDWLMDELKPVSHILDKINSLDIFYNEIEITGDGLNSINEYKKNYNGDLPYNVYMKDGKYYQRQYNSQGESMLYYMDYHWGEENGNTGENKIITAFSNQGYIDALERNYKGVWIESKVAQSENPDEARLKAERDYYILNGVITDDARYKELRAQGELSIKELIEYINSSGISQENLLSKEFAKNNAQTVLNYIKEKDSALYDILPKNIIGSLEASRIVAAIQLASGIGKFGENMGDAFDMAIHSDFAFRVTIDGYVPDTLIPNISIDFQDLKQKNENYKELAEMCWETYIKNNSLYDEEFEKYSKSEKGIKDAKDLIKKRYFVYAQHGYNFGGKIYESFDEIPISELQSTIDLVMPEVFKNSKYLEWDLDDSSSSNQFIAALKYGIRNAGNGESSFDYFDSLDTGTKVIATEQLKAMQRVEVDKTGKYMQEKYYDQDWYKELEEYSFIKHDNILGMTINQIGNMAIPVAANLIPGVGQVLSSSLLFVSAFGGASEEAINSGGSYNQALKYATLSATTEILIEKAFSGIAGFGEGWMDDLIDYIPNKLIEKYGNSKSLSTQIIKSLITGGIGEGIEEVTTDLVTPLWQSLTYMNDKSYSEIVKENVSAESLWETFLVSFLSSMVFGSSEIVQKTNQFNNMSSGLTTKINDLIAKSDNSSELKTQLNDKLKEVLAEYIGGVIFEDGETIADSLNKTNILEQMIQNISQELAADPKNAELTQELQNILNNFKNEKLTVNLGSQTTEITGKQLLEVEDALGNAGEYDINDGVVEFKDKNEQNKFVNKLYEYASKEYIKDAISTTEALRKEGSVDSLYKAIDLLKDSGKYNGTNIDEIVRVTYKGTELKIPKPIFEDLFTNYTIKKGGIVKFNDKRMNADKISKIIFGKMKNIYNTNSDKGQVAIINKATEILDQEFVQPDNYTVMSSSKVDEQDLIKQEIEVNINGKTEKVNIYIDSKTDNKVHRSQSVKDKILDIITENKKVNNASNDIYIGEISVKNGTVVVNKNEQNKNYVDAVNTALLGSSFIIQPTKTTKTTTTEKIENKKFTLKDFIPKFDLIKEIKSYVENLKSDIEKFVKEHKADIDFETKLKSFKEQKTKELNQKISEIQARINELYKKANKDVDSSVQTTEEKTKIFDDLAANMRKTLSDFETNIKSKFDSLFETATSITSETTNVITSIRNSVRNTFNNLKPNNAVNRFASKINSLTKLFEDANIKETVDEYLKTLETTQDIKVTEELISKLDSKLTQTQKEQLISTLEEIGAFVNHYGISGENLNKFYNAITMEEKPSKVIRKEINAERIAKLKDKKAVVKNVAIAGAVSLTSNPMNLIVYDQMYKYVEVRKQTGTATKNTMLGKMLESKLGKFIDSKIENFKSNQAVAGKNNSETIVKDVVIDNVSINEYVVCNEHYVARYGVEEIKIPKNVYDAINASNPETKTMFSSLIGCISDIDRLMEMKYNPKIFVEYIKLINEFNLENVLMSNKNFILMKNLLSQISKLTNIQRKSLKYYNIYNFKEVIFNNKPIKLVQDTEPYSRIIRTIDYVEMLEGKKDITINNYDLSVKIKKLIERINNDIYFKDNPEIIKLKFEGNAAKIIEFYSNPKNNDKFISNIKEAIKGEEPIILSNKYEINPKQLEELSKLNLLEILKIDDINSYIHINNIYDIEILYDEILPKLIENGITYQGIFDYLYDNAHWNALYNLSDSKIFTGNELQKRVINTILKYSSIYNNGGMWNRENKYFITKDNFSHYFDKDGNIKPQFIYKLIELNKWDSLVELHKNNELVGESQIKIVNFVLNNNILLENKIRIMNITNFFDGNGNLKIDKLADFFEQVDVISSKDAMFKEQIIVSLAMNENVSSECVDEIINKYFSDRPLYREFVKKYKGKINPQDAVQAYKFFEASNGKFAPTNSIVCKVIDDLQIDGFIRFRKNMQNILTKLNLKGTDGKSVSKLLQEEHFESFLRATSFFGMYNQNNITSLNKELLRGLIVQIEKFGKSNNLIKLTLENLKSKGIEYTDVAIQDLLISLKEFVYDANGNVKNISKQDISSYIDKLTSNGKLEQNMFILNFLQEYSSVVVANVAERNIISMLTTLPKQIITEIDLQKLHAKKLFDQFYKKYSNYKLKEGIKIDSDDKIQLMQIIFKSINPKNISLSDAYNAFGLPTIVNMPKVDINGNKYEINNITKCIDEFYKVFAYRYNVFSRTKFIKLSDDLVSVINSITSSNFDSEIVKKFIENPSQLDQATLEQISKEIRLKFIHLSKISNILENNYEKVDNNLYKIKNNSQESNRDDINRFMNVIFSKSDRLTFNEIIKHFDLKPQYIGKDGYEYFKRLKDEDLTLISKYFDISDGGYILNENENISPAQQAELHNAIAEQCGLFSLDIMDKLFNEILPNINNSSEFRMFIFNNIEEICKLSEKELKLLSKVALKYSEIYTKYQNQDDKISLEQAFNYVSSSKFNNVSIGNQRLADIAKNYVGNQYDFDAVQKIFNIGRKRVYSDIPKLEFKYNKEDRIYDAQILSLDDPTAIFVGIESNCCQRLGGPGETAMVHSVIDNSGRVFTIRDKSGSLIAQSWVWKNGNTICFDSIEIPSKVRDTFDSDNVLEIYQEVAKQLVIADKRVCDELLKQGIISKQQYEDMIVKEVIVGKGYSNIGIPSKLIRRETTIFQKVTADELVDQELYVGDTDSGQYYLYNSIDTTQTLNASENVTDIVSPNYDAIILNARNNETITSIYFDDFETINISDNPLYVLEILQKFSVKYKSMFSIDEVLDNLSLSLENSKIMIGSNFVIVYTETDSNIVIHDILTADKITGMNGEISLDEIVMTQVSQAKSQLSKKNKIINVENVSERFRTIFEITTSTNETSVDLGNGMRFEDVSSNTGQIEIQENNNVPLMNPVQEVDLTSETKIYTESIVPNISVNPITLPPTICGVDSTLAYEILKNINLVKEMLNGEFKYQFASAFKNIIMMENYLGTSFDAEVVKAVDEFYNENVDKIVVEATEDKLPDVYREFVKETNHFSNLEDIIESLEQKGYIKTDIANALLSMSARTTDYRISRAYYNYAYNYLRSYDYSEMEAANSVATMYQNIINARGFDQIVINDGITLHIQKGINWKNQPYTIDYITTEILKVKKLYKTDIPVDIYIHDTFSPEDKRFENEYKKKDFKASATAGDRVINIYHNFDTNSETLSHEYAHLIDIQIMKDLGLEGERIAQTSEWKEAIERDSKYPTEYAETNSIEDFAESVVKFHDSPSIFEIFYPNRYKVLSKYLNIEGETQISVERNSAGVPYEVGKEHALKNEVESTRPKETTRSEELTLEELQHSKVLKSLTEMYSSVPTKNLLEFMKLDVVDIGKVLIDNQTYNGYDSKTMLNAIIELYNDAKANGIGITINENLEHFINEYSTINQDKKSQLYNLTGALYNKENIIQIPLDITVSSYRNVSIIDLLYIISGKKDISTTYYSEIDLYEATLEFMTYFENKNVTIHPKLQNIFSLVKSVNQDCVIINFIDALNGKEEIVLPKKIKGKILSYKIVDVIAYLNGKPGYIDPVAIESLKEYIDTNNVNISSEMMDKINLLTSIGNTSEILNMEAYLSGNSTPIIVPKYLGLGINTSYIYGLITGKQKLNNSSKTEKVIELTVKFAQYIYSNNIILDDVTMRKLETLKNLKSNETIINLQDFFNGSTAIIVNNNINVKGIDCKISSIIDAITMTEKTHLKILSGQNIDGLTRENIFDAIEELYKLRPELRETTKDNYLKIKDIYDNNYIFEGRQIFPKAFKDIKCEIIEEILQNPNKIGKYTLEERLRVLDAINEYVEYVGEKCGKFSSYNERVKMRDNLTVLMSREIPKIEIIEEIHSPLYYLFSNNNKNGGTFGTNQGVIAKMLNDLGIKNSIKALFADETIRDDKFLEDLKQMNITAEKLRDAINDVFNNSRNTESINRLIEFINNNEVIKLVQKNFPGMNAVEAIRFLYLVETKEAGGTGICNYAAAVNMIFNKYLGKESQFESDFGYPMYVINEQGNKVLNDAMLLVDMYSIINKDVLVKEVNGKYEIETSNNKYLNLADVGRFKIDFLQKFINVKGIDLGLKQNFYYSSFEHTMWKEELIVKVKDALQQGQYINVSGAGFDLLYKDGKTALENCDGHIMTLVGLTEDGKLIVDSWGEELLIDLESTIVHLGEEYGSKNMSRRFAIATYELTDRNVSVDNNNNLFGHQNLEVFSLPGEIEMIDGAVDSENLSTPQQPIIDESMFEVETDESIEDLEPLIIDDSKQINGSNESEIRPKNITKLSIMDNIKYTLKRTSEKFAGYRVSKQTHYERTITSNNNLFKQNKINKTFRDFVNKHLIDLQTLKDSGLLKNLKISEINRIISNNRILLSKVKANISVADIIGSKKNIDLDRNFNLLFNESTSEFQTRDLGLLEYTSDQILEILAGSFKTHPLTISEVDTGKYIIEDNGYHRYSLLRLHYLNEYIKIKDDAKLVEELNKKYTIPVELYKLDYTKTYCTSLLKELGIDVKVKTSAITLNSKIFIDGKQVTMTNEELIEFTKEKINSLPNSKDIIDNLISKSNSFKEFYSKYFDIDEGIDLNKGDPKTQSDDILDIFKEFDEKSTRTFPETFNGVKLDEIINILKQPYKFQKYSIKERSKIINAINRYVQYCISNNYDMTPKQYRGYSEINKLMSRDIPNIKLGREVKSSLLTEFRNNEVNGSSFGSQQDVIRLILEKNNITDAINYLFNKDAKGTKFLEEIKDITDEEFQDLLDNAVDEMGLLDGLYNLYDYYYDLFDIMRNNFEGIEDLEIIKFLYLFESVEAGAKGICNYSAAVNMIFNKYLGKEAEFESDFGYPMYVNKNGKKVLNDAVLLVDMYSTINKEVFISETDGKFKVVATNNKNYLSVTNAGGSFNLNHLQKFFNKKGIKFDLNQTFSFDSRTDTMWKEEIIFNVRKALKKGETVNLSASGFDLYWEDGKTVASKDFDGHVMTVVGITKDGNLIVDSHGREMIVNLDSTLENAGKPYITKYKKVGTRRIGITTYSFDSSISTSNQTNDNSIDIEQDEGIFDAFKKPNESLDIFIDALSNNNLSNLTDGEIDMLVDYIKKGKIKLKEYNLTSETIGIFIDKVPLQKIYPLSNVKAIKSFIDYFGKDALVEFDKLNNNFLLGNNGENLYNLFDYYDLSVPKTNETDKLAELDNLITNAINSNKKTEYKTYTFNYYGLINSEYAKAHPELFLDDSAPQDLKDAFYNGLVNSGNEYNQEWSKYLEGKSVKGVTHEPLISYEDVKIVENVNSLGENSSKYNEALQELASRVGLSTEEVQSILSSKIQNLIENSEFGVRRTINSLLQILESNKIKNQFEVNHSRYGVYNPEMRMEMEKEMFGIPRNIKYEDRPIYGMLLPKNMSSKYVEKGPGAYYSEGNGVIFIFDKAKIKGNATLTLGDSLDQAGKVSATNLNNPKYFGMFSEMLSTIKTKEDLHNFDFTSLYEKSIMEVGNAAYYEFQLHGEESHTLDNLKEIVFLKKPEAKIIEKLKELNISWRVNNE